MLQRYAWVLVLLIGLSPLPLHAKKPKKKVKSTKPVQAVQSTNDSAPATTTKKKETGEELRFPNEEAFKEPEAARPWPPEANKSGNGTIMPDQPEYEGNESTAPVATVAPPPESPTSSSAGGLYNGKTTMPNSLGIGIVSGVDYLMPSVHLQYVVLRRLVLGVMPFYFFKFSSDDSVNGFGIFSTVTLYLSDDPFTGVHVRAGTGLYLLHGESQGVGKSAVPLAAFLNVGARTPIADRIDAGFAAGVQFVNHVVNRDPIAFGGWLPWFQADIGYRF